MDSTVSLSSLTTAAMEVSTASAASCISWPRRQTRSKQVEMSTTCAKERAANSPREKPAQTSALMPASLRASAAAISTVHRQGWVMAVCFSSSSVPSKHCREVPGRMRSARAKISAAAGEISQRDLPMPGCWAPWPGKTNATLPMRTLLSALLRHSPPRHG